MRCLEQAGNVQNLELKDSVGVLRVSIDPKFAPMHTDTKAIIRSVGLLGNKYLEVLPGPSQGPELKSGTELTIDSTTSPTDLDQINAIFDAPTRDKLKTLTLQGEIALGGRAQTLNTDLRQLRNLAAAAEPVTGIIDTHQVALDRATIAFDTSLRASFVKTRPCVAWSNPAPACSRRCRATTRPWQVCWCTATTPSPTSTPRSAATRPISPTSSPAVPAT